MEVKFTYYRGIYFRYDKLSLAREFYVYIITNPIDNEIIYIGKGKKDRYKTHLRKKSHCEKLHECIELIESIGLQPIITFPYFDINEFDAYEREIDLILNLSPDKRKLLFNRALPGPGHQGGKGVMFHTDETRKLISDAGKNRVEISEETRSKNRDYALNRPPEVRFNITIGKLNTSKYLTLDLIKEIRIRYVKDTHLSIPKIAQEMNIPEHRFRAIGTGKGYNLLFPELIPSKKLVKDLIKIRKSRTSQENTTLSWKNGRKNTWKQKSKKIDEKS